MAFDLGSLTVTIKAATKPLDDSLKEVRGKLEQLSSTKFAVRTGAILGAGMAIGVKAIDAAVGAMEKLIGAIPRAAEKAADFQMVMHRLRVIFQEFEPGIENTIKQLNKIGYPKSALGEMASDLGLMLTGMGLNAERVSDLSSKLLKLGADASVIYGMDLPEFMERLHAGLAGAERPLHRMGIFLSEAQVRMEAWRLASRGFVGATEEQQTKMARLSLIMQQLGRMAGQAGWAHKQLGGSLMEMRGRLAGLFTTFGEIVKPAYHQVILAINSVLKRVGEWLDRNKAVIMEWANYFVNMAKYIAENWKELVESIGDTWKLLKNEAWNIFKSAFTDIAAFVMSSFQFAAEYIGKLFENLLNNLVAKAEKLLKRVGLFWGEPGKEVGMMEGVPGAKRFGEIMKGWGGGKFLASISEVFAPIREFFGRAKAVASGAVKEGVKAVAPAGAVGAGGAPVFKGERLVPAFGGGAPFGAFPAPKVPAGVPQPVWAGEFGVQIAKEVAKRRERRAKVAGGIGGEGGEPTPRIQAPSFVEPLAGKSEFIGVAEFAKRIQAGALGTPEKQLSALLRIANATEVMAQTRELTGLRQRAFAVAAGP